MKKIYTFLILAVLTASSFATNIVVNGVISTNTTWDSDTVFVDGNINITGAATLTISAGSIILFNDFYKIEIDSGNVVSIGTKDAPIVFTVLDKTGYYNYSHTGWDGIEIINENDSLTDLDSTKFVYTKFSYAKEMSESYGGGVFLIKNFSKIIIDNCTFTNNYSEALGGAIGIQEKSSPTITNSSFRYNAAKDGGGALSIGCSSPSDTSIVIVEDCIFEYNKCLLSESYMGGGAIKISGSSSSIINRNYIAHNTSLEGSGASGILISGEAHPTVTNNIIVHNSCMANGGGIKVAFRTNPIILNNTIAYNSAGQGGGISIGCNTDSILIKNNIIYGNLAKKGNQFFITLNNETHTYSEWKIENNNIEGIKDSSILTVDTLSIYFDLKQDSVYYGSFVNNIDVDPLFKDTVSQFSLMACSECINAGDTLNTAVTMIDFAHENRIFDTVVDLGALEYQYLKEIIENVNENICAGDSVFLENKWQFTAGVYSDTLVGVLYCDSIVVTTLGVYDNPVVEITAIDTILNNETTTLNAGAGFASYVWNNSSTDQTLTIDGSVVGVGSFVYSVEVEDVNGCKATDTIVIVVNLFDNINNIAELDVKIYPNPNNGEFIVEANNVKVIIVDLKGNVVYIKQFYNNEIENINLTNYSKGIYFVKIISNNVVKTKKVSIY